MQASLDNPVAADPSSIPLDKIDVSDPRLYQQGIWQPYFERLRKEAPVHCIYLLPLNHIRRRRLELTQD